MDPLETREGHRNLHKVVEVVPEVDIARQDMELADIDHLGDQDLHREAVDNLLETRSFAGAVQAEVRCRSLLVVAGLDSGNYLSQGGRSSSFLDAERSGTRIEVSEEVDLVSRGWEKETCMVGLGYSLLLPWPRDHET